MKKNKKPKPKQKNIKMQGQNSARLGAPQNNKVPARESIFMKHFGKLLEGQNLTQDQIFEIEKKLRSSPLLEEGARLKVLLNEKAKDIKDELSEIRSLMATHKAATGKEPHELFDKIMQVNEGAVGEFQRFKDLAQECLKDPIDEEDAKTLRYIIENCDLMLPCSKNIAKGASDNTPLLSALLTDKTRVTTERIPEPFGDEDANALRDIKVKFCERTSDLKNIFETLTYKLLVKNEHPLFSSLIKEDTASIAEMVSNNPTLLHATTENEISPLSFALISGKENMADFLIKLGVDINKPSRTSPLTSCANPNYVHKLLLLGAQPQQPMEQMVSYAAWNLCTPKMSTILLEASIYQSLWCRYEFERLDKVSDSDLKLAMLYMMQQAKGMVLSGADLKDTRIKLLERSYKKYSQNELSFMESAIEKVLVLAWALRVVEESLYHPIKDKQALTNQYAQLTKDKDGVASSTLRNWGEILIAFRTMEAICARLREFQNNPEPINFRERLEKANLDYIATPLVEDDLSLFGEKLSALNGEQLEKASHMFNLRKEALAWLCGVGLCT